MNTPDPHINPSHVIEADPSKDFFVRMITRDLSLNDCIFDLLDNAVDSARSITQAANRSSLGGFKIEIKLDKSGFSMKDNCGGISLSSAIDYAFHFGRRKGQATTLHKSIGLYGIGMKRALFKMGRLCKVISETAQDHFSVTIDVDNWEQQDEWDLSWADHPASGTQGTQILVEQLYPTVSADFDDAAFAKTLMMGIARDYAFFIRDGLVISVNDSVVPGYKYDLKVSDKFSPAAIEYLDSEVQVKMIAGIVDVLPDDVPDELRPKDTERYGWFVICNGRVVLAADKSERTVWGTDGFPIFHPQYRGFAGFAFFDSDRPELLPWTTTKRAIDAAEPLYRRAVEKMKELTTQFIQYSNLRKADLETARATEKEAPAVDVGAIAMRQQMKFPSIAGASKVEMVTIAYPKPRKQVDEIKHILGNKYMSAKDVGIETFDYFRRMELGK